MAADIKNGHYSLESSELNPGTYKVSATANGHKATPVDVQLAEGDAKSVDLKLTK